MDEEEAVGVVGLYNNLHFEATATVLRRKEDPRETKNAATFGML